MSELMFVSRDTFDGRTKIVDERFGRDKELLDEHKIMIRTLSDLTIATNEMIKRHDLQLSDHETRLGALEKEPVENWSKLKTSFILGIVGVVSAAIGSGVMHLLTIAGS